MVSMAGGAVHILSFAIQKENNMRMLNKKFIADFWIFLKMGQWPCAAWRLAKFINDEKLPEFLRDQA